MVPRRSKLLLNDDELRLLAKTKFSDKVTEYSASLDYGIKF